jgi:hypothetical protein
MYRILRTHVHSRVLTQLVIFVFVSLGLLGAVFYDSIAGGVGVGFVLLSLVAGVGVGLLVAKIFKLVWHEDTRKVIMSLDRMSFVLIGVYVVFRIFSDQLLGQYLHGAALSAISFAFLAGILIGRFVSIWQGVTRILKQQGII